MKNVFLIYGHNDETRPNVVGVSSSDENASKLIEKLDKQFDGLFEYFVHEIPVDVIDQRGFSLFE
jgi:hypothetical protein